MRLFHSLWTKPAKDKRWDQSSQLESNIWLYTLSVLYAKSSGATIVLHTDTLGKKLLSHLPYDEIYTTLDNIPESIPSMMWAYGKFMALQREPLGSIHIDGDVFIKSPKTLAALDMTNYDMVCQNLETARGNGYGEPRDLLIASNIITKDFEYDQFAYNCGCIGFNSPALKEEYLNFYLQKTQLVAQNPSARRVLHKDKYFIFDLVLEQQSLYILSKKGNYSVKTLLSPNTEWGQVIQDAIALHYQHLIGKDKYSFIEQCKFIILATNPDIYYKTKEVIQKYKLQL